MSYLPLFLWVKDLGAARLGGSGPESLRRLQSRWQPGLQLSEGLTEAGGLTSETAPSPGCWQDASGPCHTGLSTGMLVCPRNVADVLPQSEQLKRTR